METTYLTWQHPSRSMIGRNRILGVRGDELALLLAMMLTPCYILCAVMLTLSGKATLRLYAVFKHTA